ncbi:hypothetical protein B7495_12805 [Cryobacterium sp. LW097]|uniref:hypothetical protein n=1 Tax=unclassified Cryobacterium TaxID=2649013 RepID=UPI000B4CE3BE|nr:MULTISPECIES: hypothetical protein [unclassified Cryobacterium]ASD22862.1 hypothetical protein B7495_12805 [Cryobacterium sp. LW097]TFC60846.1 hypothetical protein E3O60_05975 [Cryobacterium sp. TMB1-7]
MSHVFYGVWLVRRGGLGWATHEAKFPTLPILAHIQLSSVHLQDGDRFQMFRQQYALAYIETVNTPSGIWGIPNPNKETDNNVWLTTDHLTFQLQVDGVVTASAFGLIHDLSAGAGSEAKVTYSRDLAIFDDEGRVVGTHRVVQLEGGGRIDLDDVQERVLERATARSDRHVDVVPVDLEGIPPDAEFRINLRTRRPAPPRGSSLG